MSNSTPLRRGFFFAMLENVLKPLEPILVLLCASVFAGGPWGVFKFYETFFFMLFRMASLGMDKGVIWYYGRVDKLNFQMQISRMINLMILIVLLLIVLSFCAFKNWLPGGHYLFKGGEFEISWIVFFAFAMTLPLYVIGNLLTQALTATGDFRTGMLYRTIFLPIITYGGALLANAIGFKDQILVYALLSAHVFAFIYVFYQYCIRVGFDLRSISLNPLPNVELRRYCSPLALESTLSSIAIRVDIFLLAGVSGVKAIEVYNVITMVARSLVSLRQSFENVMLAVLSGEGGVPSEKVRQAFHQGLNVVLQLKLVIFSILFLFGGVILGLIGEQYEMGASALSLLVFFVTLNTIGDFSGSLAMSLGRTWAAPIVQGVFLSLMVILNLVLIPKYDLYGAVWAQCIAFSLSSFIWLVAAKKGFEGGLFRLEQLKKYGFLIVLYLPLSLGVFLKSDQIFEKIMLLLFIFVAHGLLFLKTKKAQV